MRKNKECLQTFACILFIFFIFFFDICQFFITFAHVKNNMNKLQTIYMHIFSFRHAVDSGIE